MSSLFERLGGLPTLQKVHKIFYDKIYADEWMSQFFSEVKQELIEAQQTDFMAQIMGGPSNYCGALPVPAHKHMYITEELFDYRHEMLKQSLVEANVPTELREAWLKLDFAFKRTLVKKSLADCQPRFSTDSIVNFTNPRKKVS